MNYWTNTNRGVEFKNAIDQVNLSYLFWHQLGTFLTVSLSIKCIG